MKTPRYTHDPVTHNRRAAEAVVPRLMERFGPKRVLDVGCGLGTWASVFAEKGCEILGLEGEIIPDDLLSIPKDRLRRVDLEEELEDQGRFDLAVCLEVAEHLSEEAGERLVSFLVASADVILFSAAVPGQGGENHKNEQWPRYWQRLFEAQGFVLDDTLRWEFWGIEEIEWWYRQNMVLALRQDSGGPRPPILPVVHPRLLEKKVRIIDDFYQGRIPLRSAVLVFGRAFLRALLSPFSGWGGE